MAEKKLNVNSMAQKELDKVEKQFDEFDKQVKDLTLDRMNQTPQQQAEVQTKLSKSEIENSKDIYLKPSRWVASQEKFNENYREQYNYAKEYVKFIAENKEIIGEKIEIWTKPFAGMPAEYWEIPVNIPVWGPRHLAEQITKCKYHRLEMKDSVTGQDGRASYYGQMVADSVIQRLDAYPASSDRKSIFMGVNDFNFSNKKAA